MLLTKSLRKNFVGFVFPFWWSWEEKLKKNARNKEEIEDCLFESLCGEFESLCGEFEWDNCRVFMETSVKSVGWNSSNVFWNSPVKPQKLIKWWVVIFVTKTHHKLYLQTNPKRSSFTWPFLSLSCRTKKSHKIVPFHIYKRKEKIL